MQRLAKDTGFPGLFAFLAIPYRIVPEGLVLEPGYHGHLIRGCSQSSFLVRRHPYLSELPERGSCSLKVVGEQSSIFPRLDRL